MVKYTAHNGQYKCSSHFSLNPSAGIGRQGILKQYWCNFVNVQVVFRIICVFDEIYVYSRMYIIYIQSSLKAFPMMIKKITKKPK